MRLASCRGDRSADTFSPAPDPGERAERGAARDRTFGPTTVKLKLKGAKPIKNRRACAVRYDTTAGLSAGLNICHKLPATEMSTSTRQQASLIERTRRHLMPSSRRKSRGLATHSGPHHPPHAGDLANAHS